jgi:hypothetical protein
MVATLGGIAISGVIDEMFQALLARISARLIERY